MKHLLIAILFFTMIVSATSCSFIPVTEENIEPHEERVYVQEFGTDPAQMGTSISGLDTWAEVTEMASHIFIGHIKDVKHVSVLETNDLWFHYDVEVIDILMNTHEPLEIGDRITVSATEGVLRASEAKALIGDSARAQKFGILQNESYADNEYVRASACNAIPIEVGKTYLMYVTDQYLEEEGLYAHMGRSHLFECNDNEVRIGRTFNLAESSFDEILTEAKTLIAQRSGQADILGYTGYIQAVMNGDIEIDLYEEAPHATVD